MPLHIQCGYCRDSGNHDSMVLAPDGNYYCIGCHAMLFEFCDFCGDQEFISRIKYHNNNRYCTQCARSLVVTCDECLIETADFVNNYFGTFCKECAEAAFSDCNVCGNTCRNRDLMTISDGRSICLNCEYEMFDWDSTPVNLDSTSHVELDSECTFGIEIETSKCPGFSCLDQNTIWACTNDYSIAGKEFISPPLKGDEGLQIIRDFCTLANTKNWEVDTHCGLHLHIGITHLEPKQLKSVAYAYHMTYDMWKQFVTARRSTDSMCGGPEYSSQDICGINTDTLEDWDYFVAERDRFEFVNWRAYLVHGTVEIRLLHGTLDSGLICNWIKAHTKFIEYVKDLSIIEIESMLSGDVYYQFSALTDIIGPDLASYYVSLADLHYHTVRHTEQTVPF